MIRCCLFWSGGLEQCYPRLHLHPHYNTAQHSTATSFSRRPRDQSRSSTVLPPALLMVLAARLISRQISARSTSIATTADCRVRLTGGCCNQEDSRAVTTT